MGTLHWYDTGIAWDAFIIGIFIIGCVVYAYWPRRPRRWRDSREVDR